jgi:hypothetical protein
MNALNPALHTDALRLPLKRPNALHPDHMTAQERQAEICSLLALAIARPNMRPRESRLKTVEMNAGGSRHSHAVLPLEIESSTHEGT